MHTFKLALGAEGPEIFLKGQAGMDLRGWEAGQPSGGPSYGLNQALVGQEGQLSWTPKSGTKVTSTLRFAKGRGWMWS